MTTPTFTLVGGPTAIIEFAGRTLITDPTFDLPGGYGPLTKTEGPAVAVETLPPIDLALISHDHHPDNLDRSGLAVAMGAALALTTAAGAVRNRGLLGLEPGATITIPGAPALTVTAVEAEHGPDGVWQDAGPVIGFVVRAEGWPTLYFSGDNASELVVERIAKDHPDVRLAVVCIGAAKLAHRGEVLLTFDADGAQAVARAWPAATIVPVHADGWAHFSQPRGDALARLVELGLGDRVVALDRGVPTLVDAAAAG